jgi:catechol 2,3-dioxygenase-like lactoylglutathione lyase family enzyme
MIDHVSIAVADLAAATDFYGAVLAPLGLTQLVDRSPATIGFGKKYPEFWLNFRDGLEPQPETTGIHICLRAPSEVAVREFFDAALARGGRSAGDPGPRQAAFTTYFGAFIFDPDGNKIEAVYFPRVLGSGFEGTTPS